MAMGMAKPRTWPESKEMRDWLRKQLAAQRAKKKDSEPWITRYTVLSSPPTCTIQGLLLAEALEDAACRLQGCATKVVITVEPNVAGESQPSKPRT